jgi:hypothetical protein
MKKLISFFMLLLLATAYPSIAYGQEVTDDGVDDGDYVEINKGDKAPFDGFLFDHGGIAAQIAKNEAEKEVLVIEKETEIKKIKIELQTELKKKDAEIELNKKLAEDISKLNKEELKTAQARLERVSWLSPTLFVGGVIAGAVFTVSVLKVAVEVVK